MMRFIKYLPILLFHALFSCVEENETIGNNPVSFYLASDSGTRSNEKESFVDGDAIGVYVLDQSAGSTLKPIGNFADNKKYVWSSEKKAFVADNLGELIFNSPDRPLTFYVYFPYYNQIADATSLRHMIDGVKKGDDFLYAICSGSSAQNIPVSFKHLLSKVNVKYTSMENRDKTAMSIYTYTDMDINLATGGVTTITNIRKDVALERVSAMDHAGFIGVVAPQTWVMGEKFGTLTYTGIGSYPFSFAQDRTFVSGQENEVYFMSRQDAYVFSVTPLTLSVPAKPLVSYLSTIISTKSDAVNGIDLPGTIVTQGYSVTSKPDWISISGSNIIVSENRSSSVRTGTITFTQDESGYTASIEVSQSAGVTTYDYIFCFSDNATSKSWSGVAASGAMNAYTVTSYLNVLVNGTVDMTEQVVYSVTSKPDWVSISGSNIIVSENRGVERYGVVTFTQTVSGKTITVNVSQDAAIVTYDYTFTFTDGSTNKSWSGVAAVGGTTTYEITSTRKIIINGTEESTEQIGYSGSATVAWITFSGSSVIVGDNPNLTPRGAVATFTQTGSGKTITVTVLQQKKNSVEIE